MEEQVLMLLVVGLIALCVFIGWKYMSEAFDAENTTETTNRARIVNLSDAVCYLSMAKRNNS